MNNDSKLIEIALVVSCILLVIAIAVTLWETTARYGIGTSSARPAAAVVPAATSQAA